MGFCGGTAPYVREAVVIKLSTDHTRVGFNSKNCSYKATGASTIKSEESSSNNNVKIEWSVADLTRSYAHLEVKSLIRPRSNTQSQPANTTNSTGTRYEFYLYSELSQERNLQ